LIKPPPSDNGLSPEADRKIVSIEIFFKNSALSNFPSSSGEITNQLCFLQDRFDPYLIIPTEYEPSNPAGRKIDP
jgi:hypothetical protein